MKRLAHLAAVLLVLTVTGYAQKKPSSAQNSCQEFVQKFYDWYVPKALSTDNSYSAVDAVHEKWAYFAPSIRKGIIKDHNEMLKTHQLANLDFDPFLDSQDPSSKFVVEHVETHNGYCVADVYGWEKGERGEHVRPRLVYPIDGYWTFIDFDYPPQDGLPARSLMTILKGKPASSP